ncbi:MAG TPA: SLBB domain-containing protein [Ignavibacteria bacterium]|nr:SLBB domain-containing protein [Ignavibacteria bacterium]
MLIFTFLAVNSYAQNDREQVGRPDILGNTTGGFYNYSDPNKVNIEVSVWGYVKYSGKYLIPEGSTIQDLISYAGGPTIDAELKDIRLFRPKNDSLGITKDQIIKLDYDDLFWNENLGSSTNKNNPILSPGDVLVFPGEPKLFFADKLSLYLAVGSTLISLAILILNISRNN